MKRRNVFVFLSLVVCILIYSLIIDRTLSYAVESPGVIYCGNDVVDLYVGDCGEGKKCELYRDDDMIEEKENLPLGSFYYSDENLTQNTYYYTVKQYLYNTEAETWEEGSTSAEVEVDTFYVWGTIHNGDEWLEKLGRGTVSWDSPWNTYLCKGVTVADGTLYISEGTEIEFQERSPHMGDDLKGKVDAREVTFGRDNDTHSPKITISGGVLKDCVFQEGVDLWIDGDGGEYTGNVFSDQYIAMQGQSNVFRENTGAPQITITSGSGCTIGANELGNIKVSGDSHVVKGNTCQTLCIDWGNANMIRENNVSLGIFISSSATGSQVLDNIMTDEQGYCGVSVKGNDNTIKDNLIQKRTVGIYVEGTVHGNTIEHNRIEDSSHYGIQLKFGPYENIIQKNTIARSGCCGIYLFQTSANQIEYNALDSNGSGDDNWLGDGGILMVDSNGAYSYNGEAGNIQNVIAFNHIWGSNTGIAVLREFCKGTGIHDNIIEDNNLGIKLEGSAGVVYNNILRRNGKHAQGSATPEGGTDNQWYHAKVSVNQNIVGGPYLGGNYWDDYTGVDADDDEIGDTSYAINDVDGNPIAEDEFPLQPGSHYADIAIDPAHHDFGTVEVGESSEATAFHISNTGTAGLTGNASITGTNAVDFAIVDNLCAGATVVPSNSCSLGVVFAPMTEGQKEAILRLSSNDLDESPLNIPLSGGGVTLKPGDLNLDGEVNLADAITALQVVASLHPESSPRGDVNGDNRVGLADAIYILQMVSNLR